MKTITFITLLFFVGFNLCAQDINLSFKSESGGGSIDSIRATNLRTKESVLIPGNYALKLVDISTGIKQKQEYSLSGSIYPNPSQGEASIVFYVGKNQFAELCLYNSGGQLINKKVQQLEPGIHRFMVYFPQNGVFLVVVKTEQGVESLKVISTAAKKVVSAIEYIGHELTGKNNEGNGQLKNALTTNSSNSSSDIGYMLHFVPGDYIYFDFYSWFMNFLRETVVVDQPYEISQKDTIEYGVVFHECIDADGNSYKVVKIGTQTWMAENLKTTSYRNGDTIANVTDNVEWSYLNSGAYCWFKNEISNKNVFGGFYNRYAVVDNRNIAPKGWHVPTEPEWRILIDFLGGQSKAGDKMRETGTEHWASPNAGATNESGFTALPGHNRKDDGFKTWYNNAQWWSTSSLSQGNCYPGPNLNISGAFSYYCTMPNVGLNVRCVMD
jgi:uncharacterized protein (TIGR02145 family)